MRPDQIKDFYKELLRDLRNNAELPRDIREDLEGAKEVAIQATSHFTIIQYETSEGVRKAHRFVSGPNGMLAVESSGAINAY